LLAEIIVIYLWFKEGVQNEWMDVEDKLVVKYVSDCFIVWKEVKCYIETWSLTWCESRGYRCIIGCFYFFIFWCFRGVLDYLRKILTFSMFILWSPSTVLDSSIFLFAKGDSFWYLIFQDYFWCLGADVAVGVVEAVRGCCLD
jgi:hypothetical protein